MPVTGPVIPLADVRAAVSVLLAGLVYRHPIPADRWDQAVVILARSHQQLGGTTRQLVYATIAAAHPDCDVHDLPRTVAALGRVLGVSEPWPTDTGVRGGNVASSEPWLPFRTRDSPSGEGATLAGSGSNINATADLLIPAMLLADSACNSPP
jgi:hypothetical protein